MDSPKVVLDACVLFSAPLRDLLLELSLEGVFRPRWTRQIQAEWTANLLRVRPDIHPEQLERTCELMSMAVPDSIISGYKKLIAQLKLPDPNDRHVLAAAIKSKSSAIITFNLKDFPARLLDSHGIRVMDPDDFLVSIFDSNPASVANSIKRIHARLKKPPLALDEYLNCLKQQKLNRFVSRLFLARGAF